MAKAKTNSPQRRRGAESFKRRMAAAHNDVLEVFQLWGDFPDCGPDHCDEMDWIHVILSPVTDVTEYARLVSSPEHDESPTVRALRRKLAAIAKACEMWDASLAKDFPNSAPLRLCGKTPAAKKRGAQ